MTNLHSHSSHHRFQREAIKLASKSVEHGNHPFGALLVIDGKVVEVALNTVLTDKDLTKHAEMNLISKLGRFSDEELRTAIIYCSTEPCAMCTGAIAWSNIRHIVYGCSAKRLQQIAKSHFMTDCRDILKNSNEKFTVEGPILMEEAAAIHESYWFKM